MQLRISAVALIVLLAICHTKNICSLTEGTVWYNHYPESYNIHVMEQEPAAPLFWRCVKAQFGYCTCLLLHQQSPYYHDRQLLPLHHKVYSGKRLHNTEMSLEATTASASNRHYAVNITGCKRKV